MKHNEKIHDGIEQITDYKKVLIATIKKHIPNCSIYLFGSRAMGLNQPTSDIDLAIKVAKQLIDSHCLDLINKDIDDLNIPFFIDVVDYNAVYEPMQKFIEKTGILWILQT